MRRAANRGKYDGWRDLPQVEGKLSAARAASKASECDSFGTNRGRTCGFSIGMCCRYRDQTLRTRIATKVEEPEATGGGNATAAPATHIEYNDNWDSFGTIFDLCLGKTRQCHLPYRVSTNVYERASGNFRGSPCAGSCTSICALSHAICPRLECQHFVMHLIRFMVHLRPSRASQG